MLSDHAKTMKQWFAVSVLLLLDALLCYLPTEKKTEEEIYPSFLSKNKKIYTS